MGAQHRILYQLFSFLYFYLIKPTCFRHLLVNLNFKIQNKIFLSVILIAIIFYIIWTYCTVYNVHTINKCIDFYSMLHFFQYRYVSVKTRHSTENHLKSSQISSKFSLLVESWRAKLTVFTKKNVLQKKQPDAWMVTVMKLFSVRFLIFSPFYGGKDNSQFEGILLSTSHYK